jgi:hypothetical protein
MIAMSDLKTISSFIEQRLVDRYLMPYNEVLFIGVTKRNNVNGGYVIRFGLDGDCSFWNLLQADKDLRKIADYEIVFKGRRRHKSTSLIIQSLATDRYDLLSPGIPVSGKYRGAISAIVFKDKVPYVLSNAHILGSEGTVVYQPHAYIDIPSINEIGKVEKADQLLDCAISRITNRHYIGQILGLGVTPSKALTAAIGDCVMKSGLVTGQTYGIITTVCAVVKKPFNTYVKCQFIIEPDPMRLPYNMEISVSGDSGAPWVKVDEAGNPLDVLLGIECGGDASDIDRDLNSEYAHATEMVSIQQTFQVVLSD